MEPCVYRSVIDNLAIPVNADVFAFLNVPHLATLDRVQQEVRHILRPTRLQALSITLLDAPRPRLSLNCSVDDYARGYMQAVGLYKCGEQMQGRYDWILRVRSDTYIPWRLASLPAMRQPTVAIVGSTAECDCGFARAPRDFERTYGKSCNEGQLCGCVDDKFALLWGHRAQDAYLLGYARDFCPGHRRIIEGMPQSLPGVGLAQSECKMGWTLASRGIPATDLRFASRLSNNPLIVRAKCSPSQLDSNNTYMVYPASLRTLPPGPLDPKRVAASCLPFGNKPESLKHQCM